MATIKLSITKDALKEIVTGATKEHERPLDEITGEKFMQFPENEETLTQEQLNEQTKLRTDIEAIHFQCGHNFQDGYALVEVKKIEVDEYVDEKEKGIGEFYFLLSLGRIFNHNLVL